ncbi:glycosyltransferase family 4 protein [Candidatus Uhrbacteria bacterium]|nr:glycosyltransferase family 4 protein [Candidatus Uhrbacteria bacterium]
MKIAHVSCVVPPHGGIGTVAMREVTGLRARGHEAVLFSPEAVENRSFVKQLPTAWRIGNASWLKGIREQVRGFDVLHLHWPYFGTIDRMLLSTADLPPIVMTFHMDARPHGLVEAVPIALERAFVQPFLFSNLKKILVSSFDYAASSSVRGLLRREPSRFVELPFGVDVDLYSPGPSARARFAVPEGAPTIFFLGGLDKAHAFKGVGNLLEAVAQLDSATHLLIVGDGDLRPQYEEQARRLGIDRRTHFLGRVDDQTAVDAFRSADVFAFPSTNPAEAFGLVALEAQACGTPVVASDLPGLRMVVKQNETGVLVKPGSVQELTQGLYRVLSDKAFRARLSEAAIPHARKFSWDAHIDGLQKVYQDVCASPS